MDISKLQYPVDEYLPENISLKTMDAFGTIPNDMIGNFDVAHMRAFGVIITHSDPMPLLKNLVSMLCGFVPFLKYWATRASHSSVS